MIIAPRSKKIRVMLTSFRDGLQSSFGGRVRLHDILPAMEFASQRMDVRHFEFGGGARFQAPYFYLGEDPFACQDAMRRAVGPDADLQILTRSVSGVTLTTQRLDALRLQASLMRKHATTWDRNFDYMNDVDNLARTAAPIVESGMHHQVCVAMMGLPFEDATVHTPEFYVDVVRQLLARAVRIDSVCMKDASGTTDPHTCYETARGLKSILPPEIPLWQHTHDTASMAVACYMAGIAGGADGVDLSVRPLASGTVQPDIRSLAHALKGTGYSLDVDTSRIEELERVLAQGLEPYEFDASTTTPDARVVAFPMPGGAIGPNVRMMKDAGILDRYEHVLAEFPIVVKAGGAWTSVTPGSQQYWLQAFNNVLHGRWHTIDEGYGRAVLGYFGRTPLAPDPGVLAAASTQLGVPPFDGDPLQAAPDALQQAMDALHARHLPVTDENIFLVAAAIVPGKDMDVNEGIRLLSGTPRIAVPLKSTEGSGARQAMTFTTPFSTSCTVKEGESLRRFVITIEPPAAVGIRVAPGASQAQETAGKTVDGTTPVYSPLPGRAELIQLAVKVGDRVQPGQVVASVEVMKAKHEVKAPLGGRVVRIEATLGSQVAANMPIMLIAQSDA